MIVSCSSIAEESDFPKDKDLYVSKYLPGIEVCKRVDVVVCHGGHGTIMQAVMAGKPVVALPFNPDQLIHSLRAQELGYGICLWNLSAIGIIQLLRFDWDEYDKQGKKVLPTKVLEAVEEVLVNSEFERQAKKCGEKLKKLDGAKLAADVVERDLKSGK